MDANRELEMMVSDALTEKPLEFSITTDRKGTKLQRFFWRLFKRESKKKDVFTIKPPTLGKQQILSKYYLMLEIDEKALVENPAVESMRICETKTDVVCSLMAVATLNTKEELLNDELIAQRAEFFKWATKPDDFSTLILAVLTQIDYVNFTNSIRLTRLLRVNKPNNEDSAERVE